MPFEMNRYIEIKFKTEKDSPTKLVLRGGRPGFAEIIIMSADGETVMASTTVDDQDYFDGNREYGSVRQLRQRVRTKKAPDKPTDAGDEKPTKETLIERKVAAVKS